MDRNIISFIVPVYNVAGYLQECIDSILSQTFNDFEIICVDDGSTDGSGDILDEYADKNPCIKVIHKENTGYGNSMNVGLDAASGEYIAIVESDDAVLPDFLETLYSAAKDNDLDIVKSECFFCWDSERYRIRHHSGELDGHFNIVLGRERLWLRSLFLMNIWTGLYRREFLIKNNIRFHESPGASYQDNGFWLQGIVYAERFMCLDYAGYLYRQDNETASVKDSSKVYAMVNEYEWLGQLLDGKISQNEMGVVDFYRLTRGYWSFYRIADERKREFLDRLIADYESHKDVFFRDLWWQDMFDEIIHDPDKYCEKVVSAKRVIINSLSICSSVIIYGAGQRGERLYRALINHGWGSKLQCFVESGEPRRQSIGRTPVYNINDDGLRLNDSAVFISASKGSKIYGEMAAKLLELGIETSIDSEQLLDNFYNLI